MFAVGESVTIRAADEFFAYVDGWTGTVAGFRSGYVVVECIRDDIPGAEKKTFLVPAAQLERAS